LITLSTQFPFVHKIGLEIGHKLLYLFTQSSLLLTHIPFEHLIGREAGHGKRILQNEGEATHDRSAHLNGAEIGQEIETGHCDEEQEPSVHLNCEVKGHPSWFLHFVQYSFSGTHVLSGHLV